ncbi:MAG TPA: DNA-processing protein DprA [Acidimicrobiales bacterium]|nr:DNA-processing protein DprA [Acidimicrobiales bacterium]
MTVPRAAYALALASLPGCGDERLRRVLEAVDGDPPRAWAAIAGEVPPDLRSKLATAAGGAGVLRDWRAAAATIDPETRWQPARDAGIEATLPGDPTYPTRLLDDHERPPVLFWRGDPSATDRTRPAVAVVGTRRCTAYGADVARELGRDLAAAGVTVVSGLALGIDGAAHEGALVGGAPPVAVVGSGLDVVYPPRHRTLWRRVVDHGGLLLAEAPPGSPPEPWRFPRRNRILAALADVVVVVESHASGGSLSTVRHATDRGVAVMAVPGSVRSPSSAGTNRLLADGVAPVVDVQDVLAALALERPAAAPARPSSEAPDLVGDPLLGAVDWVPTATEDILRRTGLPIAEAATRLTRLEVEGRVRRRGQWWERVAGPEVVTDGGYTAPS